MIATRRQPLVDAMVPDGTALSPLQKAGLAGEILSTYSRVRWLLWRRDLPATVSVLRQYPGGRASAERSSRRAYWHARRLGRAASRTLSLLPTDSRCLARSLVLLAMLARRRVETRLVIGTRQGPAFAAHAWVELAGVPLLDPGASEYERLAEM
jgi:hypothetical protein